MPGASLLIAGLLLSACGGAEQPAASEAVKPVVQEIPSERESLSSNFSDNSVQAIEEALEAKPWSVPVELVDCFEPGCIDDESQSGIYAPLESSEVTEEWHVCALLPHVKDPYWLGHNENLVKEAQRMGVDLTVYEAGGYENLTTQADQLANCEALGADAIIVSAVNADALVPQLNQLVAKGTVVIDAINGVNSSEVTARALFDYCTLGSALGDHLMSIQPEANAVWFPGPPGVGSLENLMSCFEDQVSKSNVEMLGVQYGDTGVDVQQNLVENALAAYPEMDFILGSPSTLDGAIAPLASRNLQDEIDTASYYLTESVLDGLNAGTASCSNASNDLILSRIAVDQAIRTLEGKSLLGSNHITMTASVICGEGMSAGSSNMEALIEPLNLASKDFDPTFSVR